MGIAAAIARWAGGIARTGQDCCLCTASGTGIVCSECERELPRPDPGCFQCAVPLPEWGVCGRCLQDSPAFDETAAALVYAFPVDRLVQRFKFGGDLAIGAWLGERLVERVLGEPRPDFLASPPLSPKRLRDRGFDQARILAGCLGRRMGLPVVRGMFRSRETLPQWGLGRAARRANLRGAFRVDEDLRGLHVAIVDDVLTTGATADALAQALRGAGAKRVSAWVVARTGEPGTAP